MMGLRKKDKEPEEQPGCIFWNMFGKLRRRLPYFYAVRPAKLDRTSRCKEI